MLPGILARGAERVTAGFATSVKFLDWKTALLFWYTA